MGRRVTLVLIDPAGTLHGALPAFSVAALFASWLPQIEASERPFHSFDVGDCLAEAARIGRASAAVHGAPR